MFFKRAKVVHAFLLLLSLLSLLLRLLLLPMVILIMIDCDDDYLCPMMMLLAEISCYSVWVT